MKGVYTIERKSGTAVYINFLDQHRKQVREQVELVLEGHGFASRLREAKARARDVLIKRRAEVVEDRFDLSRSRRAITFSRFVERFYTEELRERGIRTAERQIEMATTGALGRFFGGFLLGEIDEWKVRRYIKARREGALGRKVGPATINRELARLSNVWNFAARKKLVSGLNPVKEAGRLREPRNRVRYLTEDEETQLLAQLREPIRAIVEVALHTGIRRGALLGLRWQDVDFQAGIITVPEDLSKSREPYHVALNSRVHEIIEDERRRLHFTGPTDLIFCKRNGERRRSVRNSFRAACDRAGIESFRFHDLRHTAASRIVQSGGTLFDAAQHLGHRTLEMTKRYAHLSPNRLRRVADLTLRTPDNVQSISRLYHAKASEGGGVKNRSDVSDRNQKRCRRRDSNPQARRARDFESRAYTSSATPA